MEFGYFVPECPPPPAPKVQSISKTKKRSKKDLAIQSVKYPLTNSCSGQSVVSGMSWDGEGNSDWEMPILGLRSVF